MGIRIITDSTADMSRKKQREMNVDVIPLRVFFGQDEYVDGVTITPAEFYSKLEGTVELPRTAQVTPQEFERIFSASLERGDKVIAVLISSSLSGTYQSACIAKQVLESDDIFVVDSGNVTMGLHVLVSYAVELRKKGFAAPDIYHELERVKERIRVFAVIDTLKYLQKGGRLSKSSAVIGSILQVKPIIQVCQGEITVIHKVRGIHQAQAWLADMLEREGVSVRYPLCLGSTNAPEQLKNFSSLVKKLTKKAPVAGSVEIGPTVGVHAGPNCVGIGCFLANGSNTTR